LQCVDREDAQPPRLRGGADSAALVRRAARRLLGRYESRRADAELAREIEKRGVSETRRSDAVAGPRPIGREFRHQGALAILRQILSGGGAIK